MKFIYYIFCFCWSLSLNAVTLPFSNLSEEEKIGYKKNQNNFHHAFCSKLDESTLVSKPIDNFLESPNDEKFEEIIQNYYLTQADQIILKNYLVQHAKLDLKKKYQPVFEFLQSHATNCLSAQVHILGYSLSKEAFLELTHNFNKQISKSNINIHFLYLNDLHMPQTLKLNKEWHEANLENQTLPFVQGSCDQPQINPDIYNYLDKNISFDFVFGENCHFQKALLNDSTKSHESEKISLWKNKYLWMGIGLIAGSYLISKSNKELVIEY